MATKSVDKLHLRLPAGILGYPKIFRPDREEYGGDYKVKVIISVEAAKASVAKIRAFAADQFPPAVLKSKDWAWPFKVNKEEGTVAFNPRSDYKPGVFDIDGNPVSDELKIGGGTKAIVEVSFTKKSEKAAKPGLKIFLKAVQIVKLVEYKSAGAANRPSARDELDDGEEGYKAGSEASDDVDEDVAPETTTRSTTKGRKAAKPAVVEDDELDALTSGVSSDDEGDAIDDDPLAF
mgnify:CR=1 FL=1